jgi:single-strand DNA-binding protein
MDLNSVVLIGRLTRDAELKFTNAGKGVASFSLAVNGYKKDEVHFVNCQKWNAEKLASFLKKGKRVSIAGRLEQQRWEKNGQSQSRMIVTVESLQFLDSGSGSGQTSGQTVQAEPEGFPEDIPF